MGLLASAFMLTLGAGSIAITAGLARTLQMQRGREQDEFLGGRVPAELPDGFLEGSADFDTKSWKGKTFNAAERKGMNVLENEGTRSERFPFRMWVGRGLQDHEIDVLKIDYDIPENPPWLRAILDEVVEVGEGKLLGKIHLRLVPGLPFTVGYFRLEKARVAAPSSGGSTAGAATQPA